MSGEINIEPMTEDSILWRCLHLGPISRRFLNDLPREVPSEIQVDWAKCRERNIPLLTKLTRTYGACAILARVKDRIVGQLRFYPRVIWDMESAGEMCLLQDFPNGPDEDFVNTDFPPLERIQDKILAVHCLMTGSPQQKENPYLRKGVGSRLVKALIHWAKERGWERIQADAFEDIPLIYEMTGSAGRIFWEKLGFYLEDRHPHPYLQDPSEFLDQLLAQAASAGISPDRAKDRLIMRLDLG